VEDLTSRLLEIEEHILRETGNRWEVLVALSNTGASVMEKAGASGAVRLTSLEMTFLRERAAVLTHNHPSGGGLGLADFGLAVELNMRELIAFGSRYRYRLRRSGETWPELNDALIRLERIQERVRAMLQARVDSGSLQPAEASFRFWHEVWLQYASHAAVDYIRERR
jgi:hypothetical protein